MIVRISGEDQYELADEDAAKLNELDNAVVAVAMVAAAPPARARRIAAGQVVGFVVLVLLAAAARGQ